MLQKTRPFVNLQGFLGHFLLLLLSFIIFEFLLNAGHGVKCCGFSDSADCP